eukprot:UN01417
MFQNIPFLFFVQKQKCLVQTPRRSKLLNFERNQFYFHLWVHVFFQK